jgi:acetate kinase
MTIHLSTDSDMQWLGVTLDESANRAGRMRIMAEASRIRVYVIPTDEERMLAEHTVKHVD